jgi:hypothetical protein
VRDDRERAPFGDFLAQFHDPELFDRCRENTFTSALARWRRGPAYCLYVTRIANAKHCHNPVHLFVHGRLTASFERANSP